jgi:hypothetical protein
LNFFSIIVATPQVNQLYGLIWQVDDVLQLQVPMNDVIFVQLVQCSSDLVYYGRDFLDFKFLFLDKDTFVQVTSLNVLHDEVNFILFLVLKMVDKFYDVIVVDAVQNLYLLLDHQNVPLAFVLQTYLFYRV